MQYSLRELRARKEMSQKEVASAIGVSLTRYNLWERDLSSIKLRNFIKLAAFFEVDLDEIFFGKSLDNMSSGKKDKD